MSTKQRSPDPTLTVLSLGAGVQSTVLALLAAEGALPKPDTAIFADTRWEPPAVYRHLDRLADVMEDANIPFHKVSKGNIRKDALNPAHKFAAMPLHTRNPDGTRGIGRRMCTGDYKVKPIKAKVRDLLGYPHPKSIPREIWVEMWIGFSTDEIGRVKDTLDVKYLRPRHPLLELGMSRKDCQRWLGVRGWTVAKSACIGCPYHGNRMWREMRDNDPTSFADAVAFDADIRTLKHSVTELSGQPYLHRSLMPLDVAPIDRITYRERADRQVNIFDVLADSAAGWDPDEDGDPDGCSPYGCRSGGTA